MPPPTHRGPSQRDTKKATSKGPLTHFLCFPLLPPTPTRTQEQIDTSFQIFRHDVLEGVPSPTATIDETGEARERVLHDQEESIRGIINVQAIRPSGTLHLTLAVMRLATPERLEEACKALRDLDLKRLLTIATEENEHALQPLIVDLVGLTSMHTPAKTSILYAEPHDPSQRLQRIGEQLAKHFATTRPGDANVESESTTRIVQKPQEPFAVPDTRPLRLHSTIVNTKYIRSKRKPTIPTANREIKIGDDPFDGSDGHGPSAKSEFRFDARGIVERYRDFVWADKVVIDRVAICEMGAKQRHDAEGKVVGGYYHEVVSVPLPWAVKTEDAA